MWETPIYRLKDSKGKPLIVDVTSSVQPGLAPNAAIDSFISLLKEKKLGSVVDFGAGALRHTFPLLDAGFQVCAVEFQEQFAKPSCSAARNKAEKDGNFSSLIWPRQFRKDKRRFDAALLCYVLQTMPIPEEREHVLECLHKKLRDEAYLLWMSRYGQMDDASSGNRVSDGIYRYKDRDNHSFYREFTTEKTHQLFERHKFHRVRSLGVRGTEQIFVYAKGKATWV